MTRRREDGILKAPSALPARERSGTLFQEHSCQYTIYVLRRELQAAIEATGLTPIR